MTRFSRPAVASILSAFLLGSCAAPSNVTPEGQISAARQRQLNHIRDDVRSGNAECEIKVRGKKAEIKVTSKSYNLDVTTLEDLQLQGLSSYSAELSNGKHNWVFGEISKVSVSYEGCHVESDTGVYDFKLRNPLDLLLN